MPMNPKVGSEVSSRVPILPRLPSTGMQMIQKGNLQMVNPSINPGALNAIINNPVMKTHPLGAGPKIQQNPVSSNLNLQHQQNFNQVYKNQTFSYQLNKGQFVLPNLQVLPPKQP